MPPAWFVAGWAWVVAGGLAAAVTGPTGWEHGSWVAAFLVLVAGVAQLVLGAGSTHLAPVPQGQRWDRLQGGLWNGGCVVVVAGTLLSLPAAVSAGGVVLAVALVRAAVATRGAPVDRSKLLAAYRLVIIAVLVSIPIGLALSWLRH